MRTAGGLGHGLKLLDDGQPAASRPAVGGRCGVPRPGEAEHAHAHRRARAVRGRGAGATRSSSPTSPRACTWSRATARSSPCRRWRPGGRCGSTTRTSTSPTTSGTPRCPSRATRAAAGDGGARVLPAPGPLEAAVGAVAGGGRSTATAGRCSRRPTTRWSTASPASISPASCSTSPPRAPSRSTATSRGCPQPEPSGAELAARGISGAVRAVGEVAAGALGAVSKPGVALDRAREVATGIGEVAWTALNAAPDTPFNVPPGPHRRLQLVRARPRRAQAGQGRVRHHRQRRRARGRDRRARLLPAVARPPHRGDRAEGRACRSRSAPTTSAARSATR